ncbi:ubiquinol-cytochrome C chaperone family protein [Hydrogenophaga flava]|uniref:ubiquinol-cytochrome C chaperone family protein n=1 Tax=Hydrogenophaga flava TaxID=65657 RepID=UPI0008263AF4|nr:ubiquinol-cytochrome C chaperone family protein [Hydrogenophaga flava]
MTSLISDPNLAKLLGTADVDDLAVLIDHITDKGDGRISLSSDTCKRLTEAKSTGQISEATRALIAEELQRFGGNSLFNLMRAGSGVSYREILCDVASHVKADFKPKNDCAQIEIAILEAVLTQSVAKMSDQEKADLFAEFGCIYKPGAGPAVMAALQAAIKASGFGAFKLAAVVANAVAKAILGRGLAFGATAGMMRGISVFTGPIGWAITAIWTAFDLSSPAYRVTVPCVIQIAYMRQKSAYRSCPTCGTPAEAGKKFCGECGSPLALLLT